MWFAAKKVASKPIVSGHDPSPVPDITEVVFDLVPKSIDTLRTPGRIPRVASARNSRHSTIVLDVLSDFFTDARFVRAHGQTWPGRHEHRFNGLAVVDSRAGQDEVERATLFVDCRMDFRTPTAATDTDSLFPFSPSPPLAERCAFTTVLSIKRRPSCDFGIHPPKTTLS